MIKIIVYGFYFNGEFSYLRNPWNVADFVITLLSIISVAPMSQQLEVFKMFRILRILRLISRSEGLRMGLKALI